MSLPCRLCQGTQPLEQLYTFGPQPVAGYLEPDVDQARAAPTFELVIALCTGCGHVQQAHDLAKPVLLERVYSGYQPTYSMSPRVTAYLDWFVDRALAVAGASAGDLVVEVGSNDGQLLRRLAAHGVRAVGFEPAANLARVARDAGFEIVEDYFGASTAARFVGSQAPAALVVTRHTLEHAFDPIDFLRGIATLLRPGGTTVIEVPYVHLQMMRGHFEAMTFQHVSFFSVRSLENAFVRVGLELVDLHFVDMDGGSVIAYARRAGAHDAALEERVRGALHLEQLALLDRASGYADFFARVSKIRRNVRSHLEHLVERGRHVLAYGAGGKGQALLNMLALDARHVRAVIDDTPGNAGRYVPGTDIAVVGSSEPAAHDCDEILLTAPTHIDVILQKELEHGRRHVQFMATVPDFHYVMTPKM